MITSSFVEVFLLCTIQLTNNQGLFLCHIIEKTIHFSPFKIFTSLFFNEQQKYSSTFFHKLWYNPTGNVLLKNLHTYFFLKNKTDQNASSLIYNTIFT